MIDPTDDNFTQHRRATGTQSNFAPAVVRVGREQISTEVALTVFRQMIRTRALEERCIKMSKSGEAYFWIGGPGEEALNVSLGLQILKGEGPAYDYLHLHYRNSGVLLGMGMSMLDHIRQLTMTATDRHSRGRNFVGHYAMPEWNVIPVTSVIEVQMVMAPGTALMQKRHGGEGISIAVSGDAGTAEGDFESCLMWSSRPGKELPVLIIVANNGYGISTEHDSQHAARLIATRGEPHGIRYDTINGNDAVATWNAVDRAMRYVRTQRKPYILEAMVSRLHGHSSSSGAQRNLQEVDCIANFEQTLMDANVIDADYVQALRDDARKEADDAAIKVAGEPRPMPLDVRMGTYAPSSVDSVYPKDYTGLPKRKPG